VKLANKSNLAKNCERQEAIAIFLSFFIAGSNGMGSGNALRKASSGPMPFFL